MRYSYIIYKDKIIKTFKKFILTLPTDADLTADDVSDQSDDDDNERCQKGDHGAALELPAEGIIERQQRHRARVAGTQQYNGTDIARRRDKAEQANDDERRRQERDQHAAVTLQPRTAGYARGFFELGSKLDQHALGDLNAERHALDEQGDDQQVNGAVQRQENPRFENSPQKRQPHQDARNRPG